MSRCLQPLKTQNTRAPHEQTLCVIVSRQDTRHKLNHDREGSARRIRGNRAVRRRLRRSIAEAEGGARRRAAAGGGDRWSRARGSSAATAVGRAASASASAGGVGVEGVGGGMAGGVLAAIAGRRPRRQRRQQRWLPPASGDGRHLEMGLGPANEQEGQNVRAWRLGANMPGLGMRSVGCGCEMQGARGAGGWLYLQRALEVVDLPPSVREELHDGVDGSTPPSRHVGSNHDPCLAKPAGGLRCDSRRSAEILSRERGGKSKETEVERDARGSAGCAWAGPFGKLVRRVGLATLVRGRRHNAIDAGITEISPAGALEVT